MIFNNFITVRILFYFIPAIMLLSSGYITAYISLFTIVSIFFLHKNALKINFYALDYIIFFFFFISLISTLINLNDLTHFILFKSFLDIRFAILFLIIRNLFQYKLLNIKYFFVTSLFTTVFLSINIISQHIYGVDLFGIHPFEERYNSIFGSEAIAGGYIQKFSTFALLSIFLLNLNETKKKIIVFFLINLLGTSIILTNDRMPFLIFTFILFFILFFLKKDRKFFFLNIISLLLIFLFLFNNYSVTYKRYLLLKNEFNYEIIKNSLINITNKFNKNNKMTLDVNAYNNVEQKIKFTVGYISIYNAAIHLWYKSPIIGTGVKSFSSECAKLLSDTNNISCSTHPHNIYLEIIVNQGILGILAFIFLIIFIFKEYYTEYKIINKNHKNLTLYILFASILFVELLPLRSYGSIFQTVNGSIFWLILAITSSIKYQRIK
jgi:O-antigen ligase